MKSSHNIVFSLAASALLLPACATVTRGPNVDFNVATEPAGATVTTSMVTNETRHAERRRKDFIRYGHYNQDELAPIVPEYIGCAATPCSLKVARRSNFITTVSMPGYHTAEIEITNGFGKKGTTQTAEGTAAGIVGGYLVTHAAVTTMTAGLLTITTALTGTTAASGVVSSTAASAASSAAAGVGVTMIAADVFTGAMLDLKPNPLLVVLVPESEPKPEGMDAVIDTPEKYQQLAARYEATN